MLLLLTFFRCGLRDPVGRGAKHTAAAGVAGKRILLATRDELRASLPLAAAGLAAGLSTEDRLTHDPSLVRSLSIRPGARLDPMSDLRPG